MKILMVNKFLSERGGSETYMLTLGEKLRELGNEVQYFGMDSEDRCVSNGAGAYVSFIDFRSAGAVQKLQYAIKTIYSSEARKKLREVLDDFKPDIVHMNNINFQLTPSIIYEIKKHGIPMLQTLHDVQLACPNHRFYIEAQEKICTECENGRFTACVKNKCVHNSTLQSVLACAESYLYHSKNTYNLVDKYICPSYFITEVTEKSGINSDKLITLHNFSTFVSDGASEKQDYALYFGRLSVEKGVKTMLEAFSKMPEIRLIVAGNGPIEDELRANAPKNVEFVGFKSGSELTELIKGARFSLYPSEWFENCPMSVLESLSLGTPVIASDLGGTKDLIEEGKTGFIFKAGDCASLSEKARLLWNNNEMSEKMSAACIEEGKNNSLDKYAEALLSVYGGLTE